MGIPPRRASQECRALAHADTDSPLRITIYDSYANVKPLIGTSSYIMRSPQKNGQSFPVARE